MSNPLLQDRVNQDSCLVGREGALLGDDVVDEFESGDGDGDVRESRDDFGALGCGAVGEDEEDESLCELWVVVDEAGDGGGGEEVWGKEGDERSLRGDEGDDLI